MPLLKVVVVSSSRNSSETVATLERDLNYLDASTSCTTKGDDPEFVEQHQADELSHQVHYACVTAFF